MIFAKTILYVNKQKIETVYEFYKELLGLTPRVPLNYGWCEFETGSYPLCIHAEVNPNQDYQDRASAHFVFEFETEDEVNTLHKKFLDAGYSLNENWKTTKEGEVFKIAHNEKAGQHFFLVGDPVGNIVHCTCPIPKMKKQEKKYVQKHNGN